MSRLDYWGRPWAVFDANNKDHRRWFAEFQRNRTWGACPVRFIVEQNGELVSLIQRQLVDYYVCKEFQERTQVNTSVKPKSRKKHVPA